MKRDFSGNTGKAIRNSTYQLMSTIVAKSGSTILTIILARFLLGPELFGLYGLALSTILFFGIFNDLGISAAMNFFLSKNIDNNPGKAKGYFYYLIKWKLASVILTSILILMISEGLAASYQKPIYFAILAGIVYLPAVIFSEHTIPLLISTNNFRPIFIKELILQTLKLTVVPLVIIGVLSKIESIDFYLFWVIITIALCYLIAGTYLWISFKKYMPFKKNPQKKLSRKEKTSLKNFILPLIATVISANFFIFLDQIMLGLYRISSEMLGFYYLSMNLVASISVIIAFSGASMFPLLTRMSGQRLERAFKKAQNLILVISTMAFIASFVLAPIIINLLYGLPYAGAIIYFRSLSLLIISFSMINLYTAYYISQKRTKIILRLSVLSAILNIVLNYSLIGFGLRFSMSHAVLGACVATLVSRYLYMITIITLRKR